MDAHLHLESLDAWHRARPVVLPVLLVLAVLSYSLRRRYRQTSVKSPFRQYDSDRAKTEGTSNKSLELAVAPQSEILRHDARGFLPRVSDAQTSKPSALKRLRGTKAPRKSNPSQAGGSKIQPLVFYFSLTDSTRRFVNEDFSAYFSKYRQSDDLVLDPLHFDLDSIVHEDFFEHKPHIDGVHRDVQYVYLFFIPSYNIDTTLDNFLSLLKETHNDFRIDTAPLAKLAGYSVFGFGDLEGWPTIAEGFCAQATEVDKWMAKLSARKRAYPLGMGDVKTDVHAKLDEWVSGMCQTLEDIARRGDLGEGAPGSGEAFESDEEDVDESTSVRSGKNARQRQRSGIADLEDLGGKRDSDARALGSKSDGHDATRKAMVPVASPTHTALTKQGYTIIGTHSGVKICRWTKSALRGRGSCYKYSFYGIQSHLCMETTPSLSCSNKCVFCWRHGTNPVGTTWRWQVDPPDMIFAGAKEGHYKKIKMMRGVPGVRAERFQEAMKIKHCALSLVGEPIFYPHINEFLALLHGERISSFLVCNAQHPDQLAALKAVTQLYVSIDASNADSLRKIDRPLHRDYWQRFTRCLDILYEKRFRMRTVFRLTLVKGFNVDEEVQGYADLVARALPCFVEIKGVTYCGTSTSKSAGLTMQNVPFYEEIVAFVEALNGALEQRGLEYGIAAEHAHSCCALLASRRFYVSGNWHTLIDYDKFFTCLESGREFSPEDYMGPPTPEWATWGNGGFDPRDERVDRKGRPIEANRGSPQV